MKKRAKPGFRTLDYSRLRTTPLASRPSLVRTSDFARPAGPIGPFLRSLPDVYAAKGLRTLIHDIAGAHRRGRPVVAAFGGHVIKVGLAPLLIDLLDRKILTAVAMNGGAAIHDLEIGLAGRTSEDVASALDDGSFGMARETAEAFAESSSRSIGLGRALGGCVLKRGRHSRLSVLAACARLGVPCTVHLAIGADITHMHPGVSGAALGESSLKDFRTITEVVANLEGGVWLNIGSAVILPEVFLKALAVARNLRRRVRNFTTANLDMIQHYRPTVNVLRRPGGRAISITGHHEIMVPLLRAGVLTVLSGQSIDP